MRSEWTGQSRSGLSLGVGVNVTEPVVAPVSLGLGDDVALPLPRH